MTPCIYSTWRKIVRNECELLASATARDEMPEPMVTNMEADDYDSLADTTSEGEDKICLVLK